MLNDFINNHWPWIVIMFVPSLMVTAVMTWTIAAFCFRCKLDNVYQLGREEGWRKGRRDGIVECAKRYAEMARDTTARRTVEAILHRN